MTPDEELAHAQGMVIKYAEALDAMTKSCDLYREAAEAAQAALAEFTNGDGSPRTPVPGTAGAGSSPLNAIRKGLGRFRDPNK